MVGRQSHRLDVCTVIWCGKRKNLAQLLFGRRIFLDMLGDWNAEFQPNHQNKPPMRPAALLRLAFADAPTANWLDSAEPFDADATGRQFRNRRRPLLTDLPPMDKWWLEIWWIVSLELCHVLV
jgi:hypothetical protein